MGEPTARSTSVHGAEHASFRHSYTKDKAQLVRRLSRIEGQVRGIARMIEREEYCVDILQQTAALRAAIDAVSILVLEDHVQGCIRTAAERGEADQYVDEVIDVVRRTLGRPVRGSARTELARRRGQPARLSTGFRDRPGSWIRGLDAAPRAPNVRTPRGVRASGHVVREGSRGNPGRNRSDGARPDGTPSRRERTTPGAAPGWPGARLQEGALDQPRRPLPTRVSDLPELPPAYDAALVAGLAALGLALDPDARRAIDDHVRLLLAWTSAINLTAIREPAAVAVAHVVDSLTAVAPLRARGITRLLDLGSGGGFPGIPLAVALPADRTLLVDSVAKKAGFLRTVAAATGRERSIVAEAVRAEALAHDARDREAWPAVTARAVASLADLVEVGLPLVAPGGVLVAWKRAPLDDELEAAGPALRALNAGRVEIVEAGVPGLEAHRLVIVPRGGRIDEAFPRDPAERKRRPL